MSRQKFNVFARLIKIRIVSLSAATTAAGYALAAHRLDMGLLTTTVGIFLLAAASAALNQVQDRQIDAAMLRTRRRPLPAGDISLRGALTVVLGLALAGTVVLAIGAGPVPLALGLFALLWYNGVYTPLKRRTPFACVPGAIIGALPPAAGWTAAGGSLFDPRLVAVAFFFFVWQVPHFWLLMLTRESDYERAGLPTLRERLHPAGATAMVAAWTLASGVAALLLPAYGVTSPLPFAVVVLGMSLWIVHSGLALLTRPAFSSVRRSFWKINVYAAMIIGILLASGFFQTG